jgi:hypothetical protein
VNALYRAIRTPTRLDRVSIPGRHSGFRVSAMKSCASASANGLSYDLYCANGMQKILADPAPSEGFVQAPRVAHTDHPVAWEDQHETYRAATRKGSWMFSAVGGATG